jgi:hypothetical protein
MDRLKLGDEVLSVDQNGAATWEKIYFFGDKIKDVSRDFVVIKTESGKELRLTADHFIPVSQDELWSSVKMTRGGDVKANDIVWIMDSNTKIEPTRVLDTKTMIDFGVYNPYTMNGQIVVDGVVASAHSRWIFDAIWPDSWISPSWLPTIYQAIFAPIRAWYQLQPELFEAVDRAYPNGFDVFGHLSLGDLVKTIWTAAHATQ